MRIRIYNARILTMEQDREIFLGELHVEDGNIIYVGTEKNEAGDWDREIDAGKNLCFQALRMPIHILL